MDPLNLDGKVWNLRCDHFGFSSKMLSFFRGTVFLMHFLLEVFIILYLYVWAVDHDL